MLSSLNISLQSMYPLALEQLKMGQRVISSLMFTLIFIIIAAINYYSLDSSIPRKMRKMLECCNCPSWLVSLLTKPTYEDIKLAIYRLEIDKMEELLRMGAPTHQKGENLLHFAVSQNKFEAVEFLCNQYYEMIDERNEDGNTPFMLSLFGDHERITSVLFEVSSYGVRDNLGNTAFIIAAANGNITVLERIIENPCSNPTVKNFQGQTALHRAAFYGELETVKFLLDRTLLKIAYTDKSENNSLHLACLGGNLMCARYMVHKVKQPLKILEALNKDGLKPMDILIDTVDKANSQRKIDRKNISIDQVLQYIFNGLDINYRPDKIISD